MIPPTWIFANVSSDNPHRTSTLDTGCHDRHHGGSLLYVSACDDSRCTVCAERDDICTECTEGSYLTANDDCSTCPAGCISCIDGNSCTTCRDATYWDVVAVACLRKCFDDW